MDRTYLQRRRDEELQWAALASCEAARQAHTALAELLEEASKSDSVPTPFAVEREV
jgi:hypothetical protein